MEVALNQEFCELSQMELLEVDGGSEASVLGAIAIGVISFMAGPPSVITGTVAVGAWYVGSVLIGLGGVASAWGE